MNPYSYSGVNRGPASGRPPARQDRSRVTAERLVQAALKLLESRTFDELAVADIAREADRSVGAFYQRFGSKDEFLATLLSAYLENRERETEALLAEAKDESVLDAVMSANYRMIMKNRSLWHAALRKSAQDPAFWGQFHGAIHRRPELMAARLGELRGSPVSPEELFRLRVAMQVFNSAINNQMMNNPGPLTLGSPQFLPSLLKVFHAVYALETL